MIAENPCGYCTHELAGHCKGKVRHTNYKDEARMVAKPRVTICKARHCLNPLCDCLSYRKPRATR